MRLGDKSPGNLAEGKKGSGPQSRVKVNKAVNVECQQEGALKNGPLHCLTRTGGLAPLLWGEERGRQSVVTESCWALADALCAGGMWACSLG